VQKKITLFGIASSYGIYLDRNKIITPYIGTAVYKRY